MCAKRVNAHVERPSHCRQVALVLQGGGALGAYQAGVYDVLADADYLPNWIAGVSIGAINAALIAGNPPERRVERLRAFWEQISSGIGTAPLVTGDSARSWFNQWSSLFALTSGAPGFFQPRLPPPWLLADGAEGATSVYDTTPLRTTLESLINFDRMPDSTGFGDYTESGQVIPVSFKGQTGGYVHAMYLNDDAPIAGGREIWGFPKKLAEPSLRVEKDTLVGTLHYGPVHVATGTMGYKHHPLDLAGITSSLQASSYLLKIIPHVDCRPRICELVRYYLEDITVKGAWSCSSRPAGPDTRPGLGYT